jgi:SAM-dependent methyltransferase
MYTQEDLVKAYDYMFQKGEIVHPITGKSLGKYALRGSRDHFFISWIQKYYPKGSRILDASCGRGHLALSLHKLGYSVEATEVSPWLVENELSKLPFPVHLLRYDQLDQLPAKSFDCVCSNDVLEHMIDQQAACLGLRRLIRLSKTGLCICVGTSRTQYKHSLALGIDTSCRIRSEAKSKLCRRAALQLHTFTPGFDWWKKKLFSKLSGNGEKKMLLKTMHQHLLVFGWLKDE